MLQGCAFEGSKLVDASNNAPEFIALPTVHMAWVSEVEPDLYGMSSMGMFPLYFSGDREKLLMKVKFPISGFLNDKIIAGAALFLNEND